MLPSVKKIHCIGIGGAGMSPLAEMLHSRGYTVSGSDRERSSATERLERLGIAVQYGHQPLLVRKTQLVVYSSAIKPENPERVCAQDLGIAQMRRADLLGELMQGSFAVCVAGTHGKTTTTALVGTLLRAAGRNPTVLGGGEVSEWGGNAIIGGSEVLVTEADEFDRSFLAMHPSVAIITNIEADHLDCYRDLDDIKDAFVTFANKVPADGAVIACLDDEGVRDVLPRLRSPVVTYGMAGAAQFRAERAPAPAARQAMRVLQSGRLLGTVELRVPGEHNIRNALAAIAAAMQTGASFEVVQQAAATFTGVKRRLEFVGEAGGVTVIDDYAHHPSEVRASLAALRGMKYRRVLVGFQPHLYTRTRDFMDGFVQSLAEADMLAIMDIYAAREAPIAGISSQAIVDGISRRGHGAVCHAADRDELVAALLAAALPGDVVVLMGAGDIWRAITPILKGLADAAARRG